MATQLDIYYLEFFNRARKSPGAYAASLGIDLNEGLPEGTIQDAPLQPLKLNAELKSMAEAHSQDMLDNDFYGHDSPSTGYGTLERFELSPYEYRVFGENIGLVPTSAPQDLYEMAELLFESLFIDAGIEGRGHRRNILTGAFREIGIGHLIGDWQGNTDSHVLSQEFGLNVDAQNTVAGVVFQDLNANGVYDTGEGLNSIDIEVLLEGSPVATVTTDSFGYYEVDLSPGTYELRASTPDHDVVNQVEVFNSNVKLDAFWDPEITEAPAGTFSTNTSTASLYSTNVDIVRLSPVNAPEQDNTNYTLTWNIAGATKVFLDGLEVELSGSATLNALNIVTHVLEAYGPAGLIRKEVPISVSVFTPFNSGGPGGVGGSIAYASGLDAESGAGTESYAGTRTSSGLQPLYGPSEHLSVSIKRPPELYTRIARVERVSVMSRELDVSFLDGEVPSLDLYRAEVLFGTPKSFMPTPSAAIVGKGDRVVVVVDSDTYFVVSKLDRIEYPNNNRVAVYPENILYDLLSTFCIGAYFEDNEFSFADFINPETLKVTRVQCEAPDLEFNRIPRRLLRRLAFTHLQNFNMIHVDSESWPYERGGGGALATQPILVNGTVRHRRTINGLPYVLDMPFGQTGYSGNLSAYDANLIDVETAKSHPEVPDTIMNYYKGATYLWFEDPDPEWLVLITVYPSQELTKQIKFVEVPVYGWSEKARNDSEDPGVIQGVSENLIEYRRYQDLVRELDTITRTWIDWPTVESEYWFSEKQHRALSVPAIKVGPNRFKFAIHDGYGYSNGVEIFSGANSQKLLYGSVTRQIRPEGLAPNGSPYDYIIAYDDPNAATSTVDLGYELNYRYVNDGAGVEWESQKTTERTEKTYWIVYTNGVDQLFKKAKIDYYCNGAYASYPWESSGQWSGDVSSISSIQNRLWEYIYWNSTANLVATYSYEFLYTSSTSEFHVTQSIPSVHYANIEEGLFILEIIEIDLVNTLGPGHPLTSGSRERRFVVWYRGVEYILFNVVIPYAAGEAFPMILNFWPWLLDTSTPAKPESAPYDVDLNDETIFYLSPYANYFLAPIDPYVYKGMSYPTIQGDISSALFVSARNYDEEDLKADYLQVSIDPKSKSWGVTVKNILEIKDDRTVSFPDGGGDTSVWEHGVNTLLKIGNSDPTFSKPSVNETIAL